MFRELAQFLVVVIIFLGIIWIAEATGGNYWLAIPIFIVFAIIAIWALRKTDSS